MILDVLRHIKNLSPCKEKHMKNGQKEIL
jgi:hypothetical protein